MTSGEIAATNLTSPIEQPAGLCDLIGTAFRIWRRNLPLIFNALFLPTLCFFAAITILQCCITYGFDPKFELSKMLGTGAVIFVSGIGYFVSFAWLSIRQLALVRYFTGFSTDWQKALAYANKKLWWMLGLLFLSGLLSMVVIGIWVCIFVISAAIVATGPLGAVAGSIGMILGVISGIFTAGILLLVAMMGISVLACEDNVSFFGVISQSFRWTFKHFGRVICFACVYYVVFSAVSLPVSLPIVAASAADTYFGQVQSGGSAEAYKPSMLVLIFMQTWEGLWSLLLRPVSLICFGLLYLDLRQRADGLDLTKKLQKLKMENLGAENGIQGP
jgi:hypothetical protein